MTTKTRLTYWLQAILLVAFTVWLTWYLTQAVSLTEIVGIFQQAHGWAVWLGLGSIVLTISLKAWRWQLIFIENPPTFQPTFLALSLGQYINLIFPILRLGEVARIYQLRQESNKNEMVILSTVAIEKLLDLIMLVGTAVFLLPLLTLSNLPTVSPLIPIVITLLACLLLYWLAYHTNQVLHTSQWILQKLPQTLAQRLQRWVAAGLEGLAAVRNPKRVLSLILLSLLINLFSISTPYLIFLALDIPLGIPQAAIIFVGGTLVAIPSTTPAKVGVLEWSIMFMMQQLGIQNQPLRFSYAILLHIVVFLPQILFGIIATWHSNWDYKKVNHPTFHEMKYHK